MPPAAMWICLAAACWRQRSIASAISSSTGTGSGSISGPVVLHPGEVDDLLDQAGQPGRLDLHPAGEALHGLRVVGRVGDRLGEQRERADRGLELVADVGDEVAADRLDPTRAR